MVSRAGLELLTFQLDTAEFFGLSPTRWCHETRKAVEVKSPRKQKVLIFWLGIAILVVVFSLPEFLIGLSVPKIQLQSTVIRGYFLLFHWAGLLFFLSVYCSKDELGPFINNLLLFGNEARKQLGIRRIRNNYGIESFFLLYNASIAYLTAFLSPLLSLIFPCNHLLFSKSCNSTLFAVCISIWDFIVNFTVIIASGPIFTVCIMSLMTLNANLKALSKICKISAITFCQSPPEMYKITHFYRTTQLFTNLFNKCMQPIFWPSIQLVDSVFTIACIYCLLLFFDQLHQVLILIVLSIGTVVVVIIIFTLDAGSQPILYSREILNSWKHWNGSRYIRRFSKSCQPIMLHAGPFHIITRERAAIVLRFCLQRSFFLIVQTRSSHTNIVFEF